MVLQHVPAHVLRESPCPTQKCRLSFACRLSPVTRHSRELSGLSKVEGPCIQLEGARQKPVQHCLKLHRPGLRGGGTSMELRTAGVELDSLSQHHLVPQGSWWWCCSELVDEIQGTGLMAFPIKANESCVPACPAPCLVICISDQPRESVLRQGQKAFRDTVHN